MKRELGLLCIVCLGSALALAQVPVADAPQAQLAVNADAQQTTGIFQLNPADDRMTALSVVPEFGAMAVPALVPGYADKSRKLGSECGTTYICGQNSGATTWLYADLGFSSGGSTGRVTGESFPPPSETISAAVGIITWHGTYLDDGASGTTKAHKFEIKFYTPDPNDATKPYLATPVCTYANIVPLSATVVGTVNFGGSSPADRWLFTAVLLPADGTGAGVGPTGCALTSGFFSIASSEIQANAYHLIEGSLEGDGDAPRWWLSPFSWTQAGLDVAYCFAENRVGACCDERNALCENNSNEVTCNQIGGRFALSPLTCTSFSPACGSATGACCQDDNTCTVTTYTNCGVLEGACCINNNCSLQYQAACLAAGGTYKGTGVKCTTTLCAPTATGACCNGDTCAVMTEAACTSGSGTYKGDDTTCGPPNPCPTGACCTGTTCTILSQPNCIAASGTYKGDNTTCSPTNPCISICRGDASCDGLISYADINPFVQAVGSLSAWQAAHPTCPWQNCDVNADGVVSYADINPFVQKVGTPGPCPTSFRSGPDKTQGPVWMGAGTTCNAGLCPGCVVTVDTTDPNWMENEPSDCGTDTYNGGCFATPHLYKTLPLGGWFYGESGRWPGGIDYDWYKITVSAPQTKLKIQIQAEFDVAFWLFTNGNCDPNAADAEVVLHRNSMNACQDPNDPNAAVTTRCMPAGTYVLMTRPTADSVACLADYKIRVDRVEENCTFCDVTAPGTVTYTEINPCGVGGPPADTNYGCGDPNDPNFPNAFESLGADFSGLIHGQMATVFDGSTLSRDLDYYSWKLSAASRIQWTIESEVPVGACVVFDQINSINYPAKCDTGNRYTWTGTDYAACEEGTSNNATYTPDPADPNRPIWFVVYPIDPVTSSFLYDSYPCGSWGTVTNANDYYLNITTQVLSCPTVCIDNNWQPGIDPNEGEVVCSTDYTDNYNSGCDKLVADPNRMITLTDGTTICGSGGTYIRGTTERPDYDWYKITLTQSGQFYLETQGEFPYNVELYYSATHACGTKVLYEKYNVEPCTNKATYTACYPAGEYWFRVYASGTGIACGKTYYLRVSVTNAGCTQCTVTAPSGATAEGETCGADTNGGCDSSPSMSKYGTIACGQTISGTTWANDGGNDVDWYQVVLSSDAYIKWTAAGQFPGVVWVFTNPPACSALTGEAAAFTGDCSAVTHWAGDPTSSLCEPPPYLFPAGTYWLMVQPGTVECTTPTQGTVTSITEGYPCTGLRKNYYITLECPTTYP